MVASSWEPERYHRFRHERAQPFWDLLALAEAALGGRRVARAVDLGCGSGELTAAAAERLEVGEMVGIDDADTMLAAADGNATDRVRFASGDIGRWTSDADHDLVLANASLQWVPDHAAVLARWVAALGAGGALAVQVPANADHHSHLASVEVARREPFLSAFGGDPPADPVAANVLAPETYAALLYGLGIGAPHVRLQVYPHVLPSSASVVEWVSGTSLTRCFRRLPSELHQPFVDAYRRELLGRIGEREPYLYTFKRILMVGAVDRAPNCASG